MPPPPPPPMGPYPPPPPPPPQSTPYPSSSGGQQSNTPSATAVYSTASSSPTNPIITNWIKSTQTGYNGIQANVEGIYYTSSYVYVKANSIPSYSIGSWGNDPNVPTAQNFVFMFPLTPSYSSTKTATPLGPNGMMKNGVVFYNAQDSFSYNNLGVWQRNAFYWEYPSFDSCMGHPDQSGTYHVHSNPICMYNSTTSTQHSPIIGWALDGYPIYGPYGYSSPMNSSSSIKRINTSYRLRTEMTTRSVLPNGTSLNQYYWGPTINSSYPLGSYIQDYEYVSGLGDLDQYNGRWCITPEYPSGTYAYFIPTNSTGGSVYPYTIGPYYFGNVVSTARQNSIPSSAYKYYSYN